VDLHTRQLRYFVVLAEELHFTRAAARLFVAQQSLSAQIRQLEQRVGTPLLRRTTRNVELTAAGQHFLEAAREALAALDDGVLQARATAAATSDRLSLGFMVSAAVELTAPILAEFALRYPRVNVDLHEFPYDDPSVGLASSAVDVGFVRTPIALPEARFQSLFVEPLAIAVSTRHALADRTQVTVREILDEPTIAPRCSDPEWTAFWMLEQYRDGKPANIAFHTATLLEELESVGMGQPYVIITAMAAARYAPRPGVRFIPISDVPGSEVALGWRADRDSELIQAFVQTALDVRDREAELTEMIERGG
jgi:DNA-binding transcriptional LysR family regulator